MLKQIQIKIQERVDAEIAATVPTLEWELIKAIVTIEHSIKRPCFKVAFSVEEVTPPAQDAPKSLMDKWEKYVKAKENAQSLVHAIIFTLANFAKDTFQLVNNEGAGLKLSKIDSSTNSRYGGFSVFLYPKDLTEEVYEELTK